MSTDQKKYCIEVTEAEYSEIVKAIRQVNKRRDTMRNYMRAKKEKDDAYMLAHPELVEPKVTKQRGRKQKPEIRLPELITVAELGQGM